MGDTAQATGALEQPRYSDRDVGHALASIVASEGFVNSPRLRDFLTYIVEESLVGRSGDITSKTIAVDVYQRELNSDDGAQNLVRVEARRLRRLLEDYYANEGSADPLKIEIPLGGYRPSFVIDSIQPDEPIDAGVAISSARNGGRLAIFGFGLTLVLVTVALGLWFQSKDVPTAAEAVEDATLMALRERSVPSLQAANLAQQARDLLFPLFDAKQQKLALEIFQYAIELDPGIPHGYAGAAQVYATLSIISPGPVQAREYSINAHDRARRALQLNPSSAWAHGALAWTLGASGEYDEALKHANLALKLAPEDGYVLDLVGISAIISKDPALAALVSDPERPRLGGGRFGAPNIWGVSQYMLGDYPAVIDAFSGAPAAGAPVSPPSLLFLAVAYDHLGETERARKLVGELEATWPRFPAAFLVRRIFHQGSVYEKDILRRLSGLGYGSG